MLSRFRLPHTLALVALLAALALPLVGASAPVDCAPELHDRFYVPGHDGYVYPSWHAATDPATGCSYGHEHGTDPASIHPSLAPLYGYSAARMGVREPHEGFKSFGFTDDQGHGWIVTIHQGSRSVARACVRHHTLDYLVVDLASGAPLADLHAVGDFGASSSNIRGNMPLAPTACPLQALDGLGSMGSRHLPVQSEIARMYEPWRSDERGSARGVLFSELVVTLFDPSTMCDDLDCNTGISTGLPGTNRTLTLGSGFVITARPGSEGAFWTDPHARTLVVADAPGAVEQWLAPGVVLRPFGRAVTCEAGGAAPYSCGTH